MISMIKAAKNLPHYKTYNSTSQPEKYFNIKMKVVEQCVRACVRACVRDNKEMVLLHHLSSSDSSRQVSEPFSMLNV